MGTSCKRGNIQSCKTIIMSEIHPKISRELIAAELNQERFLRKTNKAGNEIYVITHHDSPNVMKEIGRLREVSFRLAGGGTGLALDIDDYDTQTCPYKQLIVWDPDASEILGGYRYQLGGEIEEDENGEPQIATTHLFRFSDQFKSDYLPYTIELGRSFVQPEYQSSKAGAKALFALDNLWDGLGALCIKHKEIKYFFGKVTMYPDFNNHAKNLILGFMRKYFPDKENLVTPLNPLKMSASWEEIYVNFGSSDLAEAYKILNKSVRAENVNIPPLVNAYMNLSPSMMTFGTAVNDTFGDVEETGIMITIADIFDNKKTRHIESYIESIGKEKGII